jgi:Protein of unknown function (DUF4230)
LAIQLSVLNLKHRQKQTNLNNKKRKGVPRFFWYAAGIAIIYLILVRLDILPSLQSIFSSKPVTIDNTPVFIKEVKNIAQLMTVMLYDEVVIDSSKTNAVTLPTLLFPSSGVQTNKLVIIARGKIIAGIDLQQIDENKIFIKDDSVSITLPKVKILEAIANPSDYEIFTEEGSWTPDEVNAVRVRAREKMIARSIQQGVLEKAAVKSKSIMESFLRSAGFKRIAVN